MGGSMRKVILVLLIVFVVPVSVYAGNISGVGLTYEGNYGNVTREAFELLEGGGKTDELYKDMGMVRVRKLPQDLVQVMGTEISKYKLDVGDCFYFSCKYDYLSFAVVVMISSVNKDGSFYYYFCAWQGYASNFSW
jgi:hypothetical protein